MLGMRSFDDPELSVGALPCRERLSCTEPLRCQGLGPSGFHPTRLRAPLAMPTRHVITCLRFERSHTLCYIHTSMDSSLSHR